MARTSAVSWARACKLMIFVGMAFALASPAAADLPRTFTYAEGDLAASATFAKDDSNGSNLLVVTLVNTSTADCLVPVDVLTGVYFHLPGVTLTPVKAVLTVGSTVLFPLPGDDGWFVNADGEREVSGEYAFSTDFDPADVPSGATMVISAVGLGDYAGNDELFPGPSWTGNPPNGLAYGIVGSDDDPDFGNTPVTGKVPLVQSGVVFTLSADQEFAVEDVGRVVFNYGTDFSPTPAPGAALLGAMGLGMVAWLKRRFGGACGAKARCGPHRPSAGG